MVKTAMATLVTEPLVAVMVSGYAPTGEFALVAMIRAVVPEPASVGGLKLGVLPCGRPDALNPIVPANPDASYWKCVVAAVERQIYGLLAASRLCAPNATFIGRSRLRSSSLRPQRTPPRWLRYVRSSI